MRCAASAPRRLACVCRRHRSACLTRCPCQRVWARRSSDRRGPCGVVSRHSAWAMARHTTTWHDMAASWHTKKMRRIMVRRPHWNSLPCSMSHRHWRRTSGHHGRSRHHMYWHSRPMHRRHCHSRSQLRWPHWNCWSCWQDAGWRTWSSPWHRASWSSRSRSRAHDSTDHPVEKRRAGRRRIIWHSTHQAQEQRHG